MGGVHELDDPVADLISHGRDREAASLASADVLAQLGQLGPLLAGVVGGIRPDQLDRPTPCGDLTVAGVLAHLTAGATRFAAAFRRRAEAPPMPAPAAVDDVLAGVGPALTELAAAIAAPGALDGTIAAPSGDVTADELARFVVLDGLVHGWDLATASGQPYEPAPALVDAVHRFARTAVPPRRDGGATFGDEVEPPPGATPVERLAAFTGRRVPARA